MKKEENIINKILATIDQYKFYFQNEKDLQSKIEKILLENKIKISREHSLDNKGVVDFFYEGVAFEIKIKGQKKSIYRQCRDYLSHPSVKALVLISSFNMSLPKEIEGKPCFTYRLN